MDLHCSSVEERETAGLKTENIPSISDRDFSEMIRETETNQMEVFKLIGNLSSKKDSLTGQTASEIERNVGLVNIERIPTSSGSREPENLTQEENHQTCREHISPCFK